VTYDRRALSKELGSRTVTVYCLVTLRQESPIRLPARIQRFIPCFFVPLIAMAHITLLEQRQSSTARAQNLFSCTGTVFPVDTEHEFEAMCAAGTTQMTNVSLSPL
jgi:hypothetical protein